MEKIDKRILKLKEQGKRGREIVDVLNDEGFRTPTGNKLNLFWLYSHTAKMNKSGVPKELVAPKRKKRYFSIPPAEVPTTQHEKVVAIIGTRDDVEKLISGWLR